MEPKKLKKGEILFHEGDSAQSMYLIQSGSLRLYKYKNDMPIELCVLRAGEVVGEMGLLDGGPRSASAEALQDTVLTEITNERLKQQLKDLPPWLFVLVKTLVSRMRNSNTKIRQLETVSKQLTYGRDGPVQTYTFLTTKDILHFCMALITCASRHSQDEPNRGLKIRESTLHKYANQILNLHMSKISELIAVFTTSNLLEIQKSGEPRNEKIEIWVKDLAFIETLMNFVNEDNLRDHSKRESLTAKGYCVIRMICKHLNRYPSNADGLSRVNLAEILKLESNQGRPPFSIEDLAELKSKHMASEPVVQDSNHILTTVNTSQIQRTFRIESILQSIELLNERKRRRAS